MEIQSSVCDHCIELEPTFNYSRSGQIFHHVPGVKLYYVLCCCQEWLSVWSTFSRNELFTYLNEDKWLGDGPVPHW